ncbi:uncharacterized protein LOC115663704 isoform X2 [Syzygium oleosum]|uniref:uncharacterized protein LOC115663704 isoform X2 n=1 Tax=Syzygium oleosum TaxID=219896 RepID=UPI0024B8B7AC|nr:uncharacterized protein LOC115663704 isoform X2 [Syzygium oleosum]
MAPPLARQLLLAQQEFREAQAKFVDAKHRNNRALNKKRYLLRAAKQRRDAAVLRLERVEGEIKNKQCLFLHNVEQVHAVVELLENLHHRGRLHRVEIKCREVEVAREMQQALQEYGFKESYDLPPA